MTYETPLTVISGAPYRVVEADGAAPTGVDDVLAATTLVLERGSAQHTVTGRGSGGAGAGRFYEKSGGPGGKDVRVWTLREVDGGVEATAG